ncbi:MAG: signal peptidase II [Atopobiaceae bacterium]|nr:signal peptidase II [Atopobiaceae bacterium]MCI2173294.1 signal peptidase II [Atopobiaceae bacterium]MCI2207289.1 signal peptidase II [Atopobiaceae bacterium]
MASRTSRLRDFALVSVIAVVLDQVTKAWASSVLVAGRAVALIPGIMDLDLVYNTGAAFSMGEGARWVFVVIALVVIGICLWLVATVDDLPRVLVVSLACVAGGGAGNLIDRVVSGKVCDFLATSFIDFPIFNVADMFVTCGVAVAFVSFLVIDGRRHEGEGQ